MDILNIAEGEHQFDDAIELLTSIAGFKDADELRENAVIDRKNAIYDEAKHQMESNTIVGYNTAIEKLETIKGWKDADELIAQIQSELPRLEIKLSEAERERKKKRLVLIACCIVAVVAVISGTLLYNKVLKPGIGCLCSNIYWSFNAS